jgi:hypothetical protein
MCHVFPPGKDLPPAKIMTQHSVIIYLGFLYRLDHVNERVTLHNRSALLHLQLSRSPSNINAVLLQTMPMVLAIIQFPMQLLAFIHKSTELYVDSLLPIVAPILVASAPVFCGIPLRKRRRRDNRAWATRRHRAVFNHARMVRCCNGLA